MIDIEQQNSTLRISYFNHLGEIDIDTIEIPRNQLFEWPLATPHGAAR
jgi:hypothetical protein